MRLHPYPTLDEGAITATWFRENDGRTLDLGSFVTDWDADTELNLGVRLRFDVDSVTEVIGSEGKVTGFAIADSEATIDRFTSTRSVLVGASDPESCIDVPLVIPAGRAAGSLRLRAGLTVLTSTAGLPAGARLAETREQRLLLEGNGSRFPVNGYPFPPTERQVPWKLGVTYDDPEDHFLGSVSVDVNTNHPAGRILLEAPEDPRHPLISSALRVDVVRTMLARLSLDERFSEAPADDVSDDALHTVADQMMTNLLGRDLQSMVSSYQSDPIAADQLMRERLRYLEPELP